MIYCHLMRLNEAGGYGILGIWCLSHICSIFPCMKLGAMYNLRLFMVAYIAYAREGVKEGHMLLFYLSNGRFLSHRCKTNRPQACRNTGGWAALAYGCLICIALLGGCLICMTQPPKSAHFRVVVS